MKRLILLLAFALAACGGGNNAPTNDNHEHDHVHSHAGTDNFLPEVKVGPWTLKPNVKGELKRGAETNLELHFTGAPTEGLTFTGFVEDAEGNVVVEGLRQHQMAEPGKFGVHLFLKDGTPEKLTMRLTVQQGETQYEAYFSLP
jgi:hypothetical protein